MGKPSQLELTEMNLPHASIGLSVHAQPHPTANNILGFLLIRTSHGCPSLGAETDVEVNGGGGTTRCTIFPRSLHTSSWSTLSLAGDRKCVYNPLQEHKAQGAASSLEIFLVRGDERRWTYTDQEKKPSGVYDCI